MRARPSLGTTLALTLVLLGLGGSLIGAMPPLGHHGWQSLQGWWTLQRFHQAEADLDYPALLQLGGSYLEQTGQGELLDFACYRVGYGASGPSSNRLPADALYWAQLGLQTLLAYQDLQPDPWPGLQTQGYILVERIFPQTLQRSALDQAAAATQDRLAAAGGLDPATQGLSQTYLRFLRTPPEERNLFLIHYLGQGTGTDITAPR